MTSMTVLT